MSEVIPESKPEPLDAPSTFGGRRPSSCSAITQAQLEDILIHEGIICGDAIEDPYGYDGGMTELRVSIATREINALLRQNVPALAQSGGGKTKPKESNHE